jgi:class 3 adenylate cyclase/tetratricopeptide (TPR) repeat protein
MAAGDPASRQDEAAATCATCGSPQPAGARFCFRCGAALEAARCTACGAQLVPGAGFCSRCGAAVDGPPAPVASRRVTSVLFGDLVAFTSLAAQRDQEEVRELLSGYFEECSRIVARYGGVVEKFIGDAVMAVWGVPVSHEDDAERCVRAGLDLVSRVEALGTELAAPELRMRVGIVTGEVAVTVGAEQQGMVAGDPVNTASRVQSAAAPGQVWVDETTRLLTSASVSYADVGSHLLKGKAEPMPLWAARAVIATTKGAQRADGLEAPLVGLDRELRMVKEAYHRAEETRRPSLLVIAGDAGTGKSRLAWEFSKYTDGLSTGCRWHAGKCVSYGEGVAYYALAEAVRSRLEIGSGLEDDAADTDALITRGLAEYVDDADERTWLAPRLGALLGTSGTSSFRRDDLYAAWTTFFERVSEGSGPIVMMIDDAQYADEGLIRFIEHLLVAASFPCFVVMLTRPELLTAHPALVTNRRCTVLHVDPLTDREMAELVDGLVEGLPTGVRDVLVERSEGIPTYAVETVRALIDRDLVVPRGGAYVLADPDALDLETIGAPASLQALISARLDRLSAEARRVVDRASVAGGSIEPTLLAELCADVEDLDQVLAELVRSQIFTVDRDRLSSDEGRYQFVQSAVRQVAYATLSRRDRKQAHLHVLEVMTRENAPELASVAAQHAMAAIEAAPDDPDVSELTERAVALLREAASRAHALGAPKEAAGHLRRALDLVDDGPLRWEIELAMASAYLDAGEYDDAIARATSAQSGFATVGDFAHEATAAAELARALVGGPADIQAAIDLVEPYYRRLADQPEHVDAYVTVLRGYTAALGRVGGITYELGLETVRAAEQARDPQSAARAVSNFAVQLVQSRHQLVGRMLLEQAISFARDIHYLEIEGHALATLSATIFADDLARSLECARDAVDVSLRTGTLDLISLSRVALLADLWATGEWDVMAAPDLDDFHADDESQATALAGLVRVARGESPTEVVQSGARREYGSHWVAIGDALAARDLDASDAVAFLKQAVDASYENTGLLDEFTSVYGAVLCLLPIDGDDTVLGHLAETVDGATDRPMLGLRAHRDLVEALRRSRTAAPDEEVDGRFRAALAGYETWGSPVYLARGRAAYGAWLAGRGRTDEAEPLLAQARERYVALGATAWLEELERRRAEVPT